MNHNMKKLYINKISAILNCGKSWNCILSLYFWTYALAIIQIIRECFLLAHKYSSIDNNNNYDYSTAQD